MSTFVFEKYFINNIFSPAGVYLDQARHTSIISSIVSNFKLPALLQYISWLKKLFIDGTNKNCGIQQLDIDEARK